MKKAAVLLVFLAGCTTSDTVLLQNAEGQQVTCGPYRFAYPGVGTSRPNDALRDCVNDYQIQGYHRVPNP